MTSCRGGVTMKSDVLIRIKRAMLAGRFVLSVKAEKEMFRDGLDPADLVEAIVNAKSI